MRLSPDDLEKRLTEFQVVENSDGEVVGAIGFQIIRSAALLHSEGYSDFSVADAARNLFWERIQTLASNHGIFRLWTQERSPFWKSFGFQPPNAEVLARLPDEWKNEFYADNPQDSLFATMPDPKIKVATYADIKKYFLKRLELIFEKVATPMELKNSTGSPLFLLCFAASNPKGAPTAVRIANYLLGEK